MRESIWQVLREESQKRREGNIRLKWILGGMTAFCLVTGLVFWWRKGEFDTTLILPPILLLTGGMTLGLSPKLKGALLKLADDPEALPFLVEALDSADRDIVPLATELLIRRLGQLREADAGLFDSAHVSALARAMLVSSNPDFTIAVMGVLRFIGTAEELSAVDLVAKGQQVNMPKAHRDRVSQLALSAAADMRLRLARNAIEAKNLELEARTTEAVGQLPTMEYGEEVSGTVG